MRVLVWAGAGLAVGATLGAVAPWVAVLVAAGGATLAAVGLRRHTPAPGPDRPDSFTMADGRVVVRRYDVGPHPRHPQETP